jgi:hypothetical protein
MRSTTLHLPFERMIQPIHPNINPFLRVNHSPRSMNGSLKRRFTLQNGE